jgi:LCP family protein required for cell wall assembly
MVVTVNPSTHQIAIINMPRDSYIPNPYYGSGDSSYDKLTHLGLVGIDNTLKGLGNYLDESINNYLILNFTTFEHIIEALGGVTVDNPYEFTALDDEYFPAGVINLTPDSALMYVREREGLPDGDFGRNMHQQMVMSAIIDKITSPSGIVNFNSMLDSIKGEFLTNLSSNAIYGLVNKQLDEGISWNVVKYHVIGETGMEVCASAPGEQLSVVYPYTNQIEYVKSVIDQVDSGEIVEQQELPDGTYTKN